MELGRHSQTAVMAEFYHYIPILRAFEFGFPIPSSTFSVYLNYITMKKTPTICISSNILLHRERMSGNTVYKGVFLKNVELFPLRLRKASTLRTS